MYNCMIYMSFFIVVFLTFETSVISWKKMVFQNRNSRGCHFLPKFSVNIIYTCIKLFAFRRIIYSHDSFSQESFCLKLLLKRPWWRHYRCHFEFSQHLKKLFFQKFRNTTLQVFRWYIILISKYFNK